MFQWEPPDADALTGECRMNIVKKILNIRETEPDYWFRQGKELCTAGYYSDGIEALDRMIAADPHHAESWFLKGYACYQMGRYEEALQFFDQSLFSHPRLAEALVYKGLISSNYGKHQEALTLYDRALAINASDTKTWYVKGLTLAILERYDDAIKAYEQALILEPNYIDALAGISNAMKKRGSARNLNGPVPPVRRHSGKPQHGQAGNPVTPKAVNIQELSMKHNDSDRQQSIQDISRGIYDMPEPNVKPAEGTSRNDSPAGAGDRYTRAREINYHDADPNGPSPTYDNTAGFKSLVKVPDPEPHLNAYEEKLLILHESLTENPDDPQLWAGIGSLLMKTGNYEQAALAYERSLALDGGNASVWGSLGDALKKRGIYDEAEIMYDRSLDIDPEQGPVWISKAKTVAMLGRYEDAIHSCRQAVLIDESNTNAWLYLGFLLKKVNRNLDALKAFDRVLTINPHHEQAIRQRQALCATKSEI